MQETLKYNLLTSENILDFGSPWELKHSSRQWSKHESTLLLIPGLRDELHSLCVPGSGNIDFLIRGTNNSIEEKRKELKRRQ